MDYSYKAVSSPKEEVQKDVVVASSRPASASASDTNCNRSEVVHANITKPLTFGVDRILASDKKDRNVCAVIGGSDVSSLYLPQMHFMMPPHIQAQLDISGASQGIMGHKRLIRPQAIRIAEGGGSGNNNNNNNCRVGPIPRDISGDCQPLHHLHHHHHHRLPFPPAAMFAAGHHSHLPVLRFNPAMYQLPPKYTMGPHQHHFLVQHQQQQQHQQHHQLQQDTQRTEAMEQGERRTHSHNPPNGQTSSKRKRSWSRAVFSNLQRKGLEIAFGGQKYITKPDRRKLAARLGLTDAQVKVWFQNRRMKWRHTGEDRKSTGAASGQPISKTAKVQDQIKHSPTSDEMYTSSEEESGCEDEIDVTD